MVFPEHIIINTDNKQSFDFLPLKNIKVFYIESPLSYTEAFKKYSEIELNLYHTGFGFQCDDIKFYIDFIVNNSIQGTILPTITNSDQLIWKNDCNVTLGDLTLDFWEESTYLCTINKDNLIKFIMDIKNNYIPNNLNYLLFRVSLSESLQDLDTPYLRSSNCDDFVIYGLNFFKNLNVEIDYISYPRFTSINIISDSSSPIKKLDYVKDKNIIINFYKDLEQKLNNLDQQILNDLKTNPALIIPLIITFYQSLGTIIYYSYDTIDKSKMSYYSIILSKTFPIFRYKATLISNNNKYITFNDMLSYKNTPKCKNDCSSNGNCNDEGICICKSSYSGDDCSCYTPNTCKNNCSNNGICDCKTGNCICFNNYKGDDCSTNKDNRTIKYILLFFIFVIIIIFIIILIIKKNKIFINKNG